ncbi:MAG: tetratricopeptide repeat protein [Dechloromonas sp.]|nr:tetratricopeptide repeat protein [Dechloromonas sp.]
MSLINQMLQDLEKRPPAEGDAALPAGVQSTSDARPAGLFSADRRRWLVLGSALLAVLCYAFWPRTTTVPMVPTLPGLAQEATPSIATPPVSVNETGRAMAATATAAPLAARSPAEGEPTPRLTRAEKRRLAREKRAAERAARASPTSAPPAVNPSAVSKMPVADDGLQRAEQSYQRALVAYGAGRHQESRALASDSLQLQPRHSAARQLLIRQNIEQGQPAAAIALLRDGVRFEPAQSAWWTLLAQLELGRGQLAQARMVIDETPITARSNVAFNSLAAAIAQRQGDQDAAAEFYRQALHYDARSGRDWVGLGLVLEQQGHRAESLEALRRGLASANLSDDLAQLAHNRLARHAPATPPTGQ